MKKLLVVAMLIAVSVRAQAPQGAAPTRPPEGASAMKDKLTQGDVSAVVIANKTAINRCVVDQKKKNPGLAGTMTVRWTVQPAGTAAGIAVQTAAYKSTYLASCITSLVKSWTFPVSRTGSAPVEFPFTF